MANNCSNYVQVTGSLELLNTLKMKLLNHFIDDEIGNESGHLNLQKLTNCKKDEDIYRKAGTSFWVVDFELNDDLIIRGDSAWSAPIELIELLSIEFKELQFEIDYEEFIP